MEGAAAHATAGDCGGVDWSNSEGERNLRRGSDRARRLDRRLPRKNPTIEAPLASAGRSQR